MKTPAILAFDTSANGLAAAWHAGGKTVEGESGSDFRRADAVSGQIARLLKEARASIADADVIAVGLGPGSFTGIRVGVSAAKTFAFAGQKKLMGFSSLQILSLNWEGAKGPVCVVQDARRGNVYTGAFDASGAVRAPSLIAIEDFMAEAAPNFYYMGSALLLSGITERLRERAGRGRGNADPSLVRPRAARMIPLVLERWTKGSFDDPLTLAPDYLYDRVCNVTLKPREGI